MQQQERRIIEVGYNLSQAYLKARRGDQQRTLLSIAASIYGFNGIAMEIIPDFKTMHIGKDLFRIGQIWHKKLLSGELQQMEGIGKGLSFEDSDFDLTL